MSSNIEPQTTAKCILYTTKGNIAIELWAKECPETCKRFLSMLSDGTFTNGEFKELKPTQWLMFNANSTGEYRTVAEEKNPRIRFNRDGLLGWDRRRNTWFITVLADSKHVLNDCNVFGKIVGKSIYIFREILGGEIEASSRDNDVKRFVYPAVLKDVMITIPFFEDIFGSKRRLEDNEKKEQEPAKKLVKSAKVKMVYEDEQEDDDGDVQKLKPRKRMILPAWIKDDSRSEGIKLDASLDQPQEAPIREKTQLHDNVHEATTKETESQENIKEEPMDKRERETLAMLSKFQERIKNKNILK
ncbi:Cwc27p [Saccharomyces cerevisiae YJM1418]|nr:Cwc27p [Saccharomyces cerevisiae YJM1418]CAI4825584.1 BAI_1a_G0054450.mRNA.1.CDS.1 [Saccharomyces cerevisiae]CAI4830118.1 CCN_G0054530.mRNA.1.CDS.1 [Saccharomyces cerevisiae]CAI7377618.1 BAI_1a_G0054450.mRNA.1.CDS.1 [Saccharomyces cerevisiae]CAI7478546.1 CCN_G0054530.mRNA.1.CDS.1 [Saccharomyces cerevisiae]